MRTENTVLKQTVEKQFMGAITPNDDLLDVLTKYANNPDKIPTLHYAVKMGDERAITLLLDSGMDVNKSSDQGTPLQVAFKQNDMSIARLLIQKKATLDSKVFDFAISNLSEEGVDLLLRSGFKPNMVAGDTLNTVIQSKLIKAVQLVLTVGSVFGPDHIESAMLYKFNDGIEVLLKTGININKNNRLMDVAIQSNNELAAKLLIQSGFDMTKMPNGGQSLLYAMKNKNISSSFLQLLIKNGISCDYTELEQRHFNSGTNIFIKNDEYSLMTAAVEQGDIAIISLLIERGVKCDQPFSPTIHCIYKNQYYLIEYPVTITNGNLSYNPLYQAVISNRADIAGLLLEHGAKPIFITNRSIGIVPNTLDWTNLIHLQQYVNLRTPEQFMKALNALTNNLDFLARQKANETKKQGVLLMTAIQNDNSQLVRVLLDAGHPVNFVGDNGKVPIKMAVEGGNREIIALLLKHGAEWDGV